MDTQLLIIIAIVFLTIVVFMHINRCNRSIEGLDAKPLSSYPEALQNLAAMYKDKKLVVDNLVVTKSIKVGGTEAAPKASIDENGNMTMNDGIIKTIKLANKWQLGDSGDANLRLQKIGAVGMGIDQYYGGLHTGNLWTPNVSGSIADANLLNAVRGTADSALRPGENLILSFDDFPTMNAGPAWWQLRLAQQTELPNAKRWKLRRG